MGTRWPLSAFSASASVTEGFRPYISHAFLTQLLWQAAIYKSATGLQEWDLEEASQGPPSIALRLKMFCSKSLGLSDLSISPKLGPTYVRTFINHSLMSPPGTRQETEAVFVNSSTNNVTLVFKIY